VPDRYLHILCEGPTEVRFAESFFKPELEKLGVYVDKTPHFGGVSPNGWGRIEKLIRNLLNNPSYHVTTLIDFYAVPGNTPGMATQPQTGSALERVRYVEARMAEVFGRNPRFIPHLALHESETWVMAAAEHLGEVIGHPRVARNLRAQVESSPDGVEGVNGGPHSHPSARVEQACLGSGYSYSKTGDGIRALQSLGLAALRAACPHLDTWLTDLVGPFS
jgi:hypothetical protein